MNTITISCSAEDVQELKPAWTAEECEEFLTKLGRVLQDRCIEEGWTIMRDLLSIYEYNQKIGIV